jgi:hypothetical protein
MTFKEKVMIDSLEFSMAMIGFFVTGRFVTVLILDKLFGKRDIKGSK